MAPSFDHLVTQIPDMYHNGTQVGDGSSMSGEYNFTTLQAITPDFQPYMIGVIADLGAFILWNFNSLFGGLGFPGF